MSFFIFSYIIHINSQMEEFMTRTSSFTSLADKAPEVLSEWDYEKNSDLNPNTLPFSHSGKVWWKCENNHETHSWQSSVYSRAIGRGKCKVCLSIVVTHPEIATEFHPTNNGSLLVSDVTKSSKEKLWWKCSKCSHEWQAFVSSRTRGIGRCFRCESLGSINPELASEWHPAKNGDKTPFDFSFSSGIKVWWQCNFCQYEWEATIDNRIRGRNCSNCNKFLKTSLPEQTIYYFLNQVFEDVENRKLLTLDGKDVEVDIYLPSLNFGIEYDGIFFHKSKKAEDEKKNQILQSNDIQLIRVREFSNKSKLPPLEAFSSTVFEVFYNSRKELEEVIFLILRTIKEKCSLTEEQLKKIKDLVVNISAVQSKIYQSMLRNLKENSLHLAYPDVAKMWHPTKNGKVLPIHLSPHSNISVWWKCEKGHEYPATVHQKVIAKNDCRVCSGFTTRKPLSDDYNLAVINPELASEWYPTKNGSLKPEDFTPNSNEDAWWKCENGHEFYERIGNRHRFSMPCSDCKIESNSIATKHPHLVEEWDYKNNGDRTPHNTTCGINGLFSWICKNGHSYEAKLITKIKGQGSCKTCKTLTYKYPEVLNSWDYIENDKLGLKPDNMTYGARTIVHWKCVHCSLPFERAVSKVTEGRPCPNCRKKLVNE